MLKNYESISYFAKKFGISKGAIRYWLKMNEEIRRKKYLVPGKKTQIVINIKDIESFWASKRGRG